MSSFSAPILIVGAGPAGLILALTLLQNGVKVRIIDMKVKQQVGQRGAGIMPRTLEMHESLGTLSDILAQGRPMLSLRKYRTPGGTVPIKVWPFMPYFHPTPSRPYRNAVRLGQDSQEGIFRSHLEKRFGCRVEQGTTLESFTQDDDSVHVVLTKDGRDGVIKENATFSWMVGTDGAHSQIRKSLGLSFLGETCKGDNMVFGDIYIASGLSEDYGHLWGDPTSRSIAFLPTHSDNLCAFVFAGREVDHATVASSREELLKAFYEITDRTDVKFGDLVWVSNYCPNIRMVETFGKGRIFLAGDAAHAHSPTGGQGMNSGVQDSFNLAWKLALVEQGLASPNLLESYTKERIPVIAAMLDMTTDLLRRTLASNDNWTREEVGQQLGVNYRGSPTIVDDSLDASAALDPYRSGGVDGIRGGDRAPDAPGVITVRGKMVSRLFNILDCTRHSVLIFSDDGKFQEEIVCGLTLYEKKRVQSVVVLSREGTYADAVSEWLPDSVLLDSVGFAYDAYSPVERGCKVFVVRPDGYVGAVVNNVDGVARYFRDIFTIN